ncbi:MAG: DUF2948 family protein [Alphaproteobacteria bacterium]
MTQDSLTHKPLKLMAKSGKDLHVLSACVQDSLIPLHGMRYDEKGKKFNVYANRYKWESHHLNPKQPHGERVHSGLSFDNVEQVEYAGFDPKVDAGNSLYLLALKHLPPYVQMTFAKDAKIRLKVPELSVKLKDSDHAPWPAAKPDHNL